MGKVLGCSQFNAGRVVWGGGWETREVQKAVGQHERWFNRQENEFPSLVAKVTAMGACHGFDRLKFKEETLDTAIELRNLIEKEGVGAVIATDGSVTEKDGKRHGGGGYAIWERKEMRWGETKGVSIALNVKRSYGAERGTALRGLRDMEKVAEKEWDKKILWITDSLGLIQGLQSQTPGSNEEVVICQLLGSIAKSNQMVVAHSRGHRDIAMNIRADELADVGSEMQVGDEKAVVSHDEVKSYLSDLRSTAGRSILRRQKGSPTARHYVKCLAEEWASSKKNTLIAYDYPRIAQVGIAALLCRGVGYWGYRAWERWGDGSGASVMKIQDLVTAGGGEGVDNIRKELYGCQRLNNFVQVFSDMGAAHEFVLWLVWGNRSEEVVDLQGDRYLQRQSEGEDTEDEGTEEE